MQEEGRKMCKHQLKQNRLRREKIVGEAWLKKNYRKETLERERHFEEQLKWEAYEKEADKERRRKEADKKTTKEKLIDDVERIKRRRKI